MIYFEIPIIPKSVQFNKRAARTKHGVRFFNDKNKESYYQDIISLCAKNAPSKPLDGAIELCVNFYLNRS